MAVLSSAHLLKGEPLCLYVLEHWVRQELDQGFVSRICRCRGLLLPALCRCRLQKFSSVHHESIAAHEFLQEALQQVSIAMMHLIPKRKRSCSPRE